MGYANKVEVPTASQSRAHVPPTYPSHMRPASSDHLGRHAAVSAQCMHAVSSFCRGRHEISQKCVACLVMLLLLADACDATSASTCDVRFASATSSTIIEDCPRVFPAFLFAAGSEYFRLFSLAILLLCSFKTIFLQLLLYQPFWGKQLGNGTLRSLATARLFVVFVVAARTCGRACPPGLLTATLVFVALAKSGYQLCL